MRTETITLLVEGVPMNCFVAHPEGEVLGGVIVLQEAFGVNAHIRDVTMRYASEGYRAVAPELFHRTHPGFESDYVEKKGVAEQMGALTDEGLLADSKAAYTWLTSEGSIAPEHIAIVGYCMGGRAAFLANSELPFAAAISYYGGRIAPGLLDRAKTQHGPLLMFWGGRDAHIPKEQHEEIVRVLEAAGKPFVNKVFPAAEHGFFCDARDSYNKEAAHEAWALTLKFLKDTFFR